MPVNDQSPDVVIIDSSGAESGIVANPFAIKDATTGTLANGTETSVAGVAVSVLAANANRKAAIIQNVGSQSVRIGVAGVTAATGIQLVAGATLILGSPYVVTGAIYAIRETAASTTVFATEIT